MAAKRVMERVSGVEIVPHFCRIEDKELEFYSGFHIIALGLDSIEARSYINAVACSFLGWYLNLLNFKYISYTNSNVCFCVVKTIIRIFMLVCFDIHADI